MALRPRPRVPITGHWDCEPAAQVHCAAEPAALVDRHQRVIVFSEPVVVAVIGQLQPRPVGFVFSAGEQLRRVGREDHYRPPRRVRNRGDLELPSPFAGPLDLRAVRVEQAVREVMLGQQVGEEVVGVRPDMIGRQFAAIFEVDGRVVGAIGQLVGEGAVQAVSICRDVVDAQCVRGEDLGQPAQLFLPEAGSRIGLDCLHALLSVPLLILPLNSLFGRLTPLSRRAACAGAAAGFAQRQLCERAGGIGGRIASSLGQLRRLPMLHLR
mmetsp:Transcript_6181/g.19801  ORF Transcript_6181/g.19801 Transcript_6181/m.19801 type:complete len:268 (-) Transcript_6181:273-1076(-)